MAYEAVIGLECHIQLATRTKMFCECPAEFGAGPNTNVCPVCLGLPGALPVANRAAIDAALQLGLALGCAIRTESVFARKNYFYPDMPKNYQISQYDRPLCEGGELPVRIAGQERRFELTRIHIEEDTGKSFHPERIGDRRISRVDFNRAGVPLLELVTEPVLHEASDCAAFLTALRRLVRWLGISDADMEKGQLRCDANVSIRPIGETRLGTKTELKNLNSIKGVEKGIIAEVARQTAVLEGGGKIEQATLLYDADHDKLAVMRSKEFAHDYRYFPEPDLPVLVVDDTWRADAQKRLPELPWTREERLVGDYALPAYDAGVLTEERDLSDYFEELARAVPPKTASNWVMTEGLRHMKDNGWDSAAWRTRMPVAGFATLLQKVEGGALTGTLAKQALATALAEGAMIEAVLARPEFQVRSSSDDLLPLVRAVVAEHPGPVSQYKAGKVQTIGFLVGQVMKMSNGQAVPQTVKQLLETELARAE